MVNKTPEQIKKEAEAKVVADEKAKKIAEAKAKKEAEAKKGNRIYFVYVDSYINDKDILTRGVYRCSKEIDRLEISKPRFVETFDENDVPEDKVHEIAKTLKVSVKTKDGKAFRKKEDILEELVEDLEIK